MQGANDASCTIGATDSTMHSVNRVFLLSPASCSGRRAALLFRGGGNFDLARRLDGGAAVPIGEIFAFISGLYFRGKLEYVNALASPHTLARVITTNRGLLDPVEPVTLDELRAFGRVNIDSADAQYREPLERDARAIERALAKEASVVLLGSVASGKYVDVLLRIFGRRLVFPADFVGRGDMSRGGLMLRHVEAGTELRYIPVEGAILHGVRPPKLEPKR
jgi:hypothetical protein